VCDEFDVERAQHAEDFLFHFWPATATDTQRRRHAKTLAGDFALAPHRAGLGRHNAGGDGL
jgi:hypothetical protein